MEIDQGRIIRLEKAKNGGWIVTQPDRNPAIVETVCGAFTDNEDMITALHLALSTE